MASAEAIDAAEYCGCGEPELHEADFRYDDNEFAECDCEMCVPVDYQEPGEETTLERGDLCFLGEPGCDCAEEAAEDLMAAFYGAEEDCGCPPGYYELEDGPGGLTGWEMLASNGVGAENFGNPDHPIAPAGYEYVLMPERPDFGTAKAPGETGHYSDLNPEPIQVIEAWGLNFAAGAALKYLARYPKKGGVEDLKKVKFFIDRLIASEERV